MECDFFSFFLFFLFYFSWPLFFCFLIIAPIVHPQCTRLGNFLIINNILTLFIKKKCKINFTPSIDRSKPSNVHLFHSLQRIHMRPKGIAFQISPLQHLAYWPFQQASSSTILCGIALWSTDACLHIQHQSTRILPKAVVQAKKNKLLWQGL